MRLYGDLAPWFHLLTHPVEYAQEADFAARALEAAADGPVSTLLELGAGGGNNASYLKHRFACTLTDVSPQMLAVCRSLNPECEHVVGDMRTLRLGRLFDAVFVHDAVMYMVTEEDLRAAITTAALHTRVGGAVLFVADVVRESFVPGTSHGGHDGEDGRALRYLEWTTDPDPADTSFDVDFALLLHGPGNARRVESDHHRLGLFPRATWWRLLDDGGLRRVAVDLVDPDAGEHEIFLARKAG